MTEHDELAPLMKLIAEWSNTAKGLSFYLYGSRVRGDHRPDSDVDLHVRIGPGVDNPTGDWWCEQNQTDFAALKRVLPGPLSILDGPDALKHAIESAPHYRTIGNVVAVWLPPKSNAEP